MADVLRVLGRHAGASAWWLGTLAAAAAFLLLPGLAFAELVTCDGACTVTFVMTPAEPDADRVADLATMFGLFIFGGVVVYFSRQLLKLFELDQNES
jgi:hypothetical protein